MSVLEQLDARGLVQGTTDRAGVDKELSTPSCVYVGFDPTADSLHVGHLLPIMTLRRLHQAGHKIIPLVGGATAMIGDPTGKNAERNLLDRQNVFNNAAQVKEQLERLLGKPADFFQVKVLNNFDWLNKMSVVDFLRDVGKHFAVQQMMNMDSVKTRFSREGEGMSFTEFSYSLLQSQDFLQLFEDEKCTIQVGGSDQWANICGGIELVRRKHGRQVFGITVPLLLDPQGNKISKTAEGDTVWLSWEKTGPEKFWQFWFNTDDSLVIDLLRKLTDVPLQEIDELSRTKFSERLPHRRLANELTLWVHGQRGLDSALWSKGKFDDTVALGELSGFDLHLRLEENLSVIDLLVKLKATPSKTEARKLIAGGGVHWNRQKVEQDFKLKAEDFVGNQGLLSKGKKNRFVIILQE